MTIQQKLDIINLVEDGSLSRQAIALKYGIGKTTVHDIHKQRDKIRTFASVINTDIAKRRRVDQKANYISEDNLYSQVSQQCEEEQTIDCIEEFDYQEISGREYEIVYETSLPVVSDELFEKPKKEKEESSPIVTKRKSKTLTFREKYEIIQQIETGVSIPLICQAYGIGRTTVYDYMRRKQEICGFVEKSDDAERKTFKKSKYPEVEQRVIEWCESRESFTKQQFYENSRSLFEEAREGGIIPSGFCGSWSWAKRFFHRHPQLKKKLVNATGQPLDPSDLSIVYADSQEDIEIEEVHENDRNSPKQVILEKSRQAKKPLKYLTLGEKFALLDEIEAGKSVQHIIAKYDVSKTTVYEIFKRKDEIRANKLTKSNASRKVNKPVRYPELEIELLEWCMTQKGTLSHTLIADKALCCFDSMKLHGVFNPSYNWAKKFVLRHPELCAKQGIKVEPEDDEEHEIVHDEIEYEEYSEVQLEDSTFEDEATSSEKFEFMEPNYEEEYIIEELEPRFDDDPETESEEQLEEDEPDQRKSIKKEQAPLVPDEIALKSLKILIKYSEQNGHADIFTHLVKYQKDLNATLS